MKLGPLTLSISLLVIISTSQPYNAILSVSWLAGHCQNQQQQHKQTCQPSIIERWDNQSHTLHGLWPDRTAEQSYGDFDIGLFEGELNLFDDMNNYWPPKTKPSHEDIFLWKHEWETHGKDYAEIIFKLRPQDFPGTVEQRNAALQVAYFHDTIELYKSLNVKKMPGASYTKGEYVSHIGVNETNLVFVCFKASWIREIHVCYQITREGFILKNCTKSTSTCSKGAEIVDLFNLSFKSQSRVFDYPQRQSIRREELGLSRDQ